MDGSFSNILHIIQKREHGFYHYPHRSCAKLFRSLLRQVMIINIELDFSYFILLLLFIK